MTADGRVRGFQPAVKGSHYPRGEEKLATVAR